MNRRTTIATLVLLMAGLAGCPHISVIAPPPGGDGALSPAVAHVGKHTITEAELERYVSAFVVGTARSARDHGQQQQR